MNVEIKTVRTLLAAGLLTFCSAVVAQDDATEPEAEASAVKPMPSEIMPLTAQSMLLDVVNLGSHLVAVGDRGAVVISTDGRKWVQVSVPVRSPLTAVSFADAENGWAVGHDAVILRTRDGGKTWVLQNFEPELEMPFLDVLFLDANRGFAVGAYGLMYETSDGGEHWTGVESDVRADELHFNSIIRLKNGDILLAGEQSTLAMSSDQGASWVTLESPYEGSMFGAVALGEKGAAIFGLRGNAYVTDDVRAGNWTEVKTDTVASMFGGTALPSGGVAMVGLNGNIVVMDANGGNVHLLKTPSGTPLSAAVPFGDELLAVGESGVQRIALQ